MAKKTFASVHTKNHETGEWEKESRELSTDDMVMYARLHDVLHGLQHHAINQFLSQSSTEDRRAVLDRMTGHAKDFFQKGSIVGNPNTGPEALKDTGCIPPYQECYDGTCQLVCFPPPNGDK